MTAARNIITYMRGDSVAGTRNRNGWKLGDIVDAAPVMRGQADRLQQPAAATSTFRAAHASRREVLYVAANDGMLHCFRRRRPAPSSGPTSPRAQLPQLSALMDPTYCHQYFLNMTPAAYDIYMSGAWKTVI